MVDISRSVDWIKNKWKAEKKINEWINDLYLLTRKYTCQLKKTHWLKQLITNTILLFRFLISLAKHYIYIYIYIYIY